VSGRSFFFRNFNSSLEAHQCLPTLDILPVIKSWHSSVAKNALYFLNTHENVGIIIYDLWGLRGGYMYILKRTTVNIVLTFVVQCIFLNCNITSLQKHLNIILSSDITTQFLKWKSTIIIPEYKIINLKNKNEFKISQHARNLFWMTSLNIKHL
jgi:hypothetical protein